jgi:hypothetical protein
MQCFHILFPLRLPPVPVLTDLLSEFPVVAVALHRGPKAFSICLWCLWLLMLSVLTQCSCETLLWWGELREERPAIGSIGNSLYSSSVQSFFRHRNTTDHTENTPALLLFTGRCLALGGCCESTIIAFSKSVTIFSEILILLCLRTSSYFKDVLYMI